jgi:hypothetical protein
MENLATNLENSTEAPEKSPEDMAADLGMAERDLATVAKRVAGEEMMTIRGIEREVSEGEESMVFTVGDAPVAKGVACLKHLRDNLKGVEGEMKLMMAIYTPYPNAIRPRLKKKRF